MYEVSRSLNRRTTRSLCTYVPKTSCHVLYAQPCAASKQKRWRLQGKVDHRGKGRRVLHVPSNEDKLDAGIVATLGRTGSVSRFSQHEHTHAPQMVEPRAARKQNSQKFFTTLWSSEMEEDQSVLVANGSRGPWSCIARSGFACPPFLLRAAVHHCRDTPAHCTTTRTLTPTHIPLRSILLPWLRRRARGRSRSATPRYSWIHHTPY